MATTVNVLSYLQTRTQVDVDSLDIEAARRGGPDGPWTDATSNQAEVFFQIEKAENIDTVREAINKSQQLHATFPSLTLPELMVEVATVLLAARVLPFITGSVHVMANPCYAFSIPKIVETGHRYHEIFRHVNPDVDLSRVVMKVPATFEGLRACRELHGSGIKTLATTVFTMEQAILAGEAGCVSISPFIHELKMGFDSTYKDNDSLVDLCVKAQQYYEQHSIPTRVKACSCITIDEILQLAGVAAHTIPPEDLDALVSMKEDKNDLDAKSLFKPKLFANGHQQVRAYIDDEAKYRVEFAASDGGKGQLRLYQAVSIFSDFQKKAELKMESIGA
ncbi:hypothetical protein BGW36DRAFT_383752 [Talaromyces proteolyticus]|uniref:Transaldolase n=1 Tax=Talaromyces proteolyticus TaxID=1131652 RepID=A0AAD4KML9_9EURO|nr:uncharacterized protein BGW36DRAFT_383752 [Talaromyces proteolyticus]KAH8693800.1 hypothetical protein BGW36DRAFT_383752 [Talaromyces proteolyticus]